MPPALLDTDMLWEIIKLRNPIVQQHALAYAQQFGPFCFRR